MQYYGLAIGIIWFVFIAYWVISAFSSKRTVQRSGGGFGILIRLVFVILVVWFFASHSGGQGVQLTGSSNPIADSIGVLLVAVGVAFAIWARVYLGKNWGMPMTLKENPELVTGGPYRFVRHPIYTGIITAILGSAIIDGVLWLFIFVGAFAYFIYSAKVEERIMTKQFPNEYPAYKARTKLLIPFIW